MTILAVITGVNAIGNGLYTTICVLYYTLMLDHSVAFVSLALFGAMILAISADLVGGRLADTRGPKEVFLSGLAISMLAMLAMLLAKDSFLFIVAITLAGVGQGLCMSSNIALIRRSADADPVMARATLRSFLTLGLALGGLVGALVVATNNFYVYSGAIVVNAITFLCCSVLAGLLQVKNPPRGDAVEMGDRLAAIRNARFVGFTVVSALISIHNHVLPFAVPLWIAAFHPEVAWIAAIAMVANTVVEVTLQVYVSDRIRSGRGAVIAFCSGSAIISSSYIALAWMSETSVGVAIVLSLGFAVVYSVGEMAMSAGSMDLQFRIAPAELQGQYSAVFGMMHGFASAAAPSVLGLIVTVGKPIGWLALAAATCLLSPMVLFLTRRHEFRAAVAPSASDNALTSRNE
ncbi:MFS transporter [Nonomuraea maritima]|nr:MFS transporter [Nonomuraea maritima]